MEATDKHDIVEDDVDVTMIKTDTRKKLKFNIIVPSEWDDKYAKIYVDNEIELHSKELGDIDTDDVEYYIVKTFDTTGRRLLDGTCGPPFL